jgi:hypothetical protein
VRSRWVWFDRQTHPDQLVFDVVLDPALPVVCLVFFPPDALMFFLMSALKMPLVALPLVAKPP